MNKKTFRTTIVLAIFALSVTACSGVVPEIQGIGEPVAGSPPQDGGSFEEAVSAPSTNSVTKPFAANTGYLNLDTGQVTCYDDRSAISCPQEGEAFYGQDAQYSSNQLSYIDNGDGTITDLNTGLMWIKDPGDKMYYYDAIVMADSFSFAGYNDWRVPTIKELYSLMDFSGIDDAISGTDPFIDTDYFIFEYGDPSIGEREIDSQCFTTSIYEASVVDNSAAHRRLIWLQLPPNWA